MRNLHLPKLKNSHGDTIIEVMLAMTLLTSFLFISWGITNKATQIGINSQKRVEMVNAMKEQAEIIKAEYAKNGYSVDTLIDPVAATNTGLDKDPCTNDGVAGNNTFHFANESGNLNKLAQKKLVPNVENALWVQYKPSSGSIPDYYDFYIRACWQTVGSAQNTDNAQFIVRLNKALVSSVVTSPSDTFTEYSGTTTLAFEDYRPGVDRDYNDYVVNMKVSERYKNDYLEEITIEYTPRYRGACFDHELWLVFDGVVYGGINNTGASGSRSHVSTEMFAGNATIAYSLTTNGITGASQNIAKNSNARLFQSTAASLVSNQKAGVKITGFEQIAANTKTVRGDFSIKRYRTFLRVPPQTVTSPGCSITAPGDDIDIVDIHPNMLDGGPSSLSPYPLAFFVPDDWQWPGPGVNIDTLYPNFDLHAKYLYDNRNNPNPPAEQAPPAGGLGWYNK